MRYKGILSFTERKKTVKPMTVYDSIMGPILLGKILLEMLYWGFTKIIQSFFKNAIQNLSIFLDDKQT